MFVPRVNLPEHMPAVDSRWIIIDDRQQVLLVNGAFPVASESPVPGTIALLGLQSGVPVYAVGAGKYPDVPDEYAETHQWVGLRPLYGTVPDPDWGLAGRASQVLTWQRDHQFCGRCGTATEPHPIDRARQCPRCSLQSFPRLTPAIITLVEREDGKALLAWGAAFPARFYSALAGFVEPGESLEECVAREVNEEVGVEVDNITYFGSQPWPFPHSVMIGFQARYRSGDITIQPEEIIEADWFGPKNLPPVPRGRMSIAGWLIEDWLRRTA